MIGTNGGQSAGDGTFASIEDAMGSYADEDEQGAEQSNDQQANGNSQQDGDVQDGLDDQQQDEADADEFADEQDQQEDQGDDQAGRFVAHTSRIRLPDGTDTTIADLLRSNDDVGQKQSALAEKERQFEGVRQQVKQQYEELQPARERLAAFAQALMPKRPDPAMMQTDLVGYNYAMDAYQRSVEMLNGIQADYQRTVDQQDAEAKAASEKFKSEQAQKLVQRDPSFAKDDVYNQFWRDMMSIGGRVYGYSAAELKDGMVDHRQYLVMRDALNWQRMKAKQRAGNGAQQRQQQQNGQQRRVMTGSQRPGNPDLVKRQAAQERFNKNPTLKNAVDLID